MNQNNELLACYKVFSLLERASGNAEAMLDHMPGVMVVLNKHLQVIRANLEFAQIANCSMDDILGFDFTSLFSPDDTGKLLRHIAYLTSGGAEKKQIGFELEIQPSGNEKIARQYYWHASIMSVKNSAEGDLISITGKDLSELYQSEMKLKNIFSNLPLGMLTIDSEGKVKDVLSQFTEIIFNSSNLVGKSFISLFNDAKSSEPELNVGGLKNLLTCFGQSKTHYNDIAATLPSVIAIADSHCASIKWVSINYQPILKLNRVDGFILMIEDATEMMNAKREMERVSELERQIQAVYEAAIRDPLTGLYTRLYMKESVKSLTSSLRRGAIDELAIVMMDVDHFKGVNDTYGHNVGDSVLSKIGQIILRHTRDTDIAIRYGGEEFLVVLPSQLGDMTSGKLVAERIRKDVADFELKLRAGIVLKVTISAGAALCSRQEPIEAAIERADGYLYQAKRLGRNKVVSEGEQ